MEAFKAQISLNSASGPRISPDGSMIAFTITSADWENNRFDREIWLAPAGGDPFPLTRTKDGNSTGARWAPDGSRLGFVADRGDGAQIYLIRPQGGEAEQLTSHEGGINSFRFSPDGSRVAFAATDPAPDDFEEREETYGDYAVEDADFRMAHLWVTDMGEGAEPRRLTGGDGFHVGTFAWSPDGSEIAFDHAPTPQVNSFRQTDVSVVEVASATVRSLVADPGRQRGPALVAGRRAHPLFHLGGRESLLRELRTRRHPRGRRRLPRPDRRIRREPVPTGVERRGRLLHRLPADGPPTVRDGSRIR